MSKLAGQSDYNACLRALLPAIGWKGSERHLQEALPHYSNITSAAQFCEVMKNLNYHYQVVSVKMAQMDKRLFPCLFVSENGKIYTLLAHHGKSIDAYDPEINQSGQLLLSEVMGKSWRGRVYVFQEMSWRTQKSRPKKSWIFSLFSYNRQLIVSSLGLSFILNLLMLATPLFVMNVYDKVINAVSYSMLSSFVLGILVAVVGIVAITWLRAQHFAIIGARLDGEVGNAIFSRLLYMSPSYTESASIGLQVARIKDFDRLREFLSGPLITTFYELPFTMIALGLIAVLGGILVIIPLLMMIIFFVYSLSIRGELQRRLKKAALYGAQLQEFVMETITHLRIIKCLAMRDIWQTRYRKLSSDSVLANLHVNMLANVTQVFSYLMMISSGMAVLSFGAVEIIQAKLSIGALIAVMILIWRVLMPFKMIFTTLPRLEQVGSSLAQLDRLMKIETEREASSENTMITRQIIGNINFDRVSFRYPGAVSPSLMGVSFSIKAGEWVGIAGRNGAGKSTLLKLILRLYEQQAGSIRIDNQDIRQINPIELRHVMDYMPHAPELFHGTIAENLRLVDPNATDEALCDAAEKAGILNEIMRLHKGFDTRLHGHSTRFLSSSFVKNLCLARTYLKKSTILLLDEPTDMLNEHSDKRLIEMLNKLRGKTTVLMATHRLLHLELMDKVVLLDQGQIVMQGKPEDVLTKMPKELL